MNENEIGTEILKSAIDIHRDLGPGLLESVYEVILEQELKRKGFEVNRQVAIPIRYKGLIFEEGFRADLIVEKQVLVELKSIESVSRVHAKQVLTYLKLLDIRLGYLMNFGAELMKNGVTRLVNQMREDQ